MTTEEFKQCLLFIGLKLTNKEINAVVKSIDDFRSNTVEYEQFFMYLKELESEALANLKDLKSISFCALSTSPNVRYVPPKTGRVTISVELSYANDAEAACLTEAQVIIYYFD